MTRPSSYTKPGEDDPALATINQLIYSHPGEGKTCLWGSGREKVFIMASDPEGTISARSLGYKFHSAQVTDYDELQEVYEWLKNDRPTDFSWVVWDSLTLFQDRVLIDDLMPDAVATNPNQEEYAPSRREYLINMNRISQYVRLFVDLPYNFGISCHVMTTAESGGDGTIFMPQVQGKNMPSKISGYMNVVGYMGKREVPDPKDQSKKKKVQTIQFQRQGRYYAKDRFGVLGTFMDHPTLPKIEGLVDEWRKTMSQQKKVAVAKPSTSAPSTSAPAPRRPATAK